MTTRPAVVGLLRHYVYITNAYPDSDVLTIWTYAAGAPSAARRAYERGAILAWLTAQWKTITISSVSATRLVTWDCQTAPPTKVDGAIIFPAIVGTGGTGGAGVHCPKSLAAVVALRSEPVGSNVRNRLNGRLFHGGLTTNTGAAFRVANDQLVNTFPGDNVYNDLRVRLRPATDANSGTWVIPSWRAGGAPRVPPLMVPVNHVLVRPQVGVQRRRMPRAGAYPRGY